MALEDIIPVDALLGKLPAYGDDGEKGKKKKKGFFSKVFGSK